MPLRCIATGGISPAAAEKEFISTPHPGPLLVGRGEGDAFAWFPPSSDFGAAGAWFAVHLIRPAATLTHSLPLVRPAAGFRLCRTPFAVSQTAQVSPSDAEKEFILWDDYRDTKSSAVHIFRSGPAERISISVPESWWKKYGVPQASTSSPLPLRRMPAPGLMKFACRGF
jgi:hypothetical protein